MAWFRSLNTQISDWQGRRVWIVGASSGIGAALAADLDARGARLALSARSAGRLRDVAEGMRDVMLLPLDVTDAGAFTPAMMQILDAWGGLDLVILNAGTYTPLRAWDLTTDTARQTVHTNLLGVMDGVAAVCRRCSASKVGRLPSSAAWPATGACPGRWPTGRARRR